MQVFSVALRATRNAWRDLRSWSFSMDARLHALLTPQHYVLSQNHFEDLCLVRDKLRIMAQLAGVEPGFPNLGDDALVSFRRSALGQVFLDMSLYLDMVLTPVLFAAERELHQKMKED
jgi:hypothetical protein